MRESVKNKWIDALGIGEPAGPMGKIAKSAIGEFRGTKYLATEKLKDLLEKAGYKVKDKPKERGVVVEVLGPVSHLATNDDGTTTLHTNPEGMVAAGYDSNLDEALATALYGTWREEQADFIIDAELQKRGIKVNEELRIKLQNRFITEGGLPRLQADLDAFPKAE